MAGRRPGAGARRPAAAVPTPGAAAPPVDGGFTLVEVVVSLTVLAVGILATVQVFVSSLGVVGDVGERARAVALATREMEGMHALPYEVLGLGIAQPDFLAMFEGRTTVEVPNPLIEPRSAARLGGLPAEVERHVTWADATSPDGTVAYTRAYKRVTVGVSWTDAGNRRSVRVDGIIYPGGRGAHVGSVTTLVPSLLEASPPAAPFGLAATLRPAAEHSTVDLSWNAAPSVPEVATWVVQYSTDGFATTNEVTSTQPGSVRTLTVAGLSPSTAYAFRVAGRSSTGASSAWSNVATATTAAAAPPGCQVGTASITPNAVPRRDNGTTVLASDAMVTVNTSGSCGPLRLSYRPTTGTTATVFLTSMTGGVWTGTVNGTTTSWDIGTRQVDVVDQSGNVVATLAFTVCTPGQRTCP